MAHAIRTPRISKRTRTRTLAAAIAAASFLLTDGVITAPAEAAPASASRTVQPLSERLEEIRARQAAELYGDPAVRPVDERKTSLVSLGDSEISGEGVGTYEPGTNGPDNWCHRSPDAAIHRTRIPTDVTFNIACSGAETVHIRVGGSKQYPDELVQSDNLAIKARNTRVKLVLLVVGANDDLHFGPVLTDCVSRWFLLRPACAPVYDRGWKARIDALVPKVEQTVRDLRTVMTQAGYTKGDYRLVVMGYPSPVGPDFEDNPRFSGKLLGGCTTHTSDMAWSRHTAVPLFERGMAEVARRTGAYYLDNSRLFHGHEVCMDKPWVRGLHIDLTNPFPPDSNSVRQSFHPNHGGHGAFASCLTQFWKSGLRAAGCADPASTGKPVLHPGAWAFAPLRNEGTGSCIAASAASTRNGTALQGWDCHGGPHQRFAHDDGHGPLRIEASHDRCLDVSGSGYQEGARVVLWNCDGEATQKFTRDGGTIRPQAAPGLCVTLPEAKERLRLARCDGSASQRFS